MDLCMTMLHSDVLTMPERGVRDIAFSGDGEPTTFRRFEEAVRIAADARRRFGLDSAKACSAYERRIPG